MTVQSLFPILRTTDLPRLAAFYTAAFGAVVSYQFGDDYVALQLGPAALGIGRVPDVTRGDQISVWLYVDDVDASYAAVLSAGATERTPPQDMPWGERVADAVDPDGNLLHLGAAAAQNPSSET